MVNKRIKRYNKSIRTKNFIIKKISNPTKGEKQADGLIDGGDRNNGYAWAMAELNNYIYIGSNRNIIYSAIKNSFTQDNLANTFTNIVFKGDVPTNTTDFAAEIFRYNKVTKKMELVYKSETTPEGGFYESGYRSAIAFKPYNENKKSIYIGAFGNKYTRILKFKENYVVGVDKPEVVFIDNTGTSSVRAMTTHEDKLYFGLLINDTDLRIMESASPDKSNWNIVADLRDFKNIPSVDSGSAGAGGIFDLISYNGYLYAIIGSGSKPIKESGFLVFKGKYLGRRVKGTNKHGWKWEMIVGPNGKYEAGMGVPSYAIATPFKYRASDGKEYVYVGTFSNVLQCLEKMFNFDFSYLYKNFLKPTELYRFDENDNWEIVIGTPCKYEEFNNRIGNYKAGFVPEDCRIKYSSIHYIWRMDEYDGKLFLGTFDSSTLYDYLIPKKITDNLDDFNEILKLLLDFISNINYTNSTKIESLLDLFNNTEYCNDLNILRSLELFLPENLNYEIENLIANTNKSNNYKRKLPILLSKIKAFLTSEKILKQIYYMKEIRKMLDNSVKGCNLYFSKDGVNFYQINNNGFNDKFNYGARTFVSSDDGLYIGTANPFYGGQLWRLNKIKPDCR